MSALPPIADIGADALLVRSMPGGNIAAGPTMRARGPMSIAGSLCTKYSNNNNGGFSGFLKVGCPDFPEEFPWMGPIGRYWVCRRVVHAGTAIMWSDRIRHCRVWRVLSAALRSPAWAGFVVADNARARARGAVEVSSLATQVKIKVAVLTEALMGALAVIWLMQWLRRRA